jgi:hypothetical protein
MHLYDNSHTILGTPSGLSYQPGYTSVKNATVATLPSNFVLKLLIKHDNYQKV